MVVYVTTLFPVNHPRRCSHFFAKVTIYILIGMLILLPHFQYLYGQSEVLLKKESKIWQNPSEFGTQYTAVTMNNWLYWQYLSGLSAYSPDQDKSTGSVFPKNGAVVVYADGIVWGGKIDGQIRVGGNTYWSGVRALLDKIYRVRLDIHNISLKQLKNEAAVIWGIPREQVTDEQLSELYDAYLSDMENWPVEDGAPWIDKNGNNLYEPGVDEPGVANASQIVYNVVDDLDEGRTLHLYGSPPIGIRAQITHWVYQNPASRVGQVIFKRVKLKNISGNTIHDMYVSIWSDPDIGDYTDDVSGCDSVLGLAFAYNGFDADQLFNARGLAPAALGYDFIQGPVVPAAGDTAKINFQFVDGFKNLSMTAFCYWPSGGNYQYSDPAFGKYTGTIQWYNLMRGFMPVEYLDNPPPFRHATNGAITKFPVNGDPITGEGEIDGVNNNFYPSARRMAATTGPFTMAPGDEQDIIIAVIGGRPGETRLDAVADLKETDRLVQKWADDLFRTEIFDLPNLSVQVSELDNRIILNWGANLSAVKEIESKIIHDTPLTAYKFEGYAVYQTDVKNPDHKDVLIATYDKINGIRTVHGRRFIPEFGEEIVIPIFHGSDSGIQRSITIDRDYFTDNPLINGRKYYYKIVAYYYNPDPQLLKDSLLVTEETVEAIPQAARPGTRYPVPVGMEIPVEHVEGHSEAKVVVRVVDPTQLTGHTYQIHFQPDPADPNTLKWELEDGTTGQIKVQNIPLAQSWEKPDGAQVFVDGLEIWVADVSADFTGFWVIANANGLLPEPEPAASPAAGFPVPRTPGDNQQVGSARWLIASIPENRFSYRYEDFVRLTSEYAGGLNAEVNGMATVAPDDYEIRFTNASAGFFNWSTQTLDSVPFECWDIGTSDDPTDDFQLFPFIQDLETTENQGVFNITNRDHPISMNQWDPMTDGIYFIVPEDHSPGSKGYEAIYNYIKNKAPSEVVGDSLWKLAKPGLSVPGLAALTFVNLDGGLVPDEEMPWQNYPYNQLLPENGTIFRITTTNPVTVSDVYQFQAPEIIVGNVELERQDVQRITVYPNPFLGDQVSPDGSLVNYVTFYHLPHKATVRIFNLAGQHVKTLRKADTSQFLRWDLTNSSGKRVAGGMYIAHIQMTLSDGSRVEKTIKLFVSDVQRTWLK